MVDRIRELLSARQFTPTQFADTIGVARPIVSHILSGRNKPSLEVIQKIVDAFPDLSLPWLLKGVGNMNAIELPPTGPAPLPIPSVLKRASTKAPETPLPAVIKDEGTPTPAPPSAASVAVASEANLKAGISETSSLGLSQPIAPLPEPNVATVLGPQGAAMGSPSEPVAFSTSMPVAGSPVSHVGATMVAAAEVEAGKKSESAIPAAAQPFLKADKAIRRIVIFYQDGTFTDYQPENA
jgi:transcriptional regulator with XRE-family HTH domain